MNFLSLTHNRLLMLLMIGLSERRVGRSEAETHHSFCTHHSLFMLN